MIGENIFFREDNDMYFDNLSCGDCKRCIIGKEGYPICEETGERVYPKSLLLSPAPQMPVPLPHPAGCTAYSRGRARRRTLFRI